MSTAFHVEQSALTAFRMGASDSEDSMTERRPQNAAMTPASVGGPLGKAAELVLQEASLLLAGRSQHQTYEVWDTPAFGRLYCLDGDFMAAEADACRCHESLVHVTAIAHPAPRHALVIGGGDGGSAQELLRHPSIESVVVVELDAEVVAFSRQLLGGIHGGALDDPRVALHIGDGVDYVRRLAREEGERYDLVVFDLTDARGSAAALHNEDFFRACRALLNPGGALVVQLGSPFHQPELVADLFATLGRVFTTLRPYLVDVPLYGGAWALACAADVLDPTLLDAEEVERRLRERRIEGLRHYNGDIHRAQFALPNDLRTMLDIKRPVRTLPPSP